MEPHRCHVKSLDDFLVCQEQNCYANTVNCTQCFQYNHFSQSHGKKVLHQSLPFTDSKLFLSFKRLIQIEDLLQKKLMKDLSTFSTNYQVIAMYGLTQSEMFEGIFGKDQKLVNDYYVLRTVYYGGEVMLYSPPSEEFCIKLKSVTEAKLGIWRQTLQGTSKEWNFMGMQINYLLGNHAQRLETSIVIEQQYFAHYCQQLSKTKQNFDIFKYLQVRKEDESVPYDSVYFSRQFEDFLIQKYQKNASEKGVFEVDEYVNGFWKYFSFLSKRDPNVQFYFQFELDSYQMYKNEVQTYGVQKSLLGFKAWKLVNRPSQEYLNAFSNHYYYQSYIMALIDLRIKTQLNGQKDPLIQVQEFSKYLKDYCDCTPGAVDLNEYESYFIFRRDNYSFLLHLQSANDIIYNHTLAIKYLTDVFRNSLRPALKKYRQYLEQDQINKQMELENKKAAFENLKEGLMKEEGQKFYEYVFSNFVVYAKQKSRPLVAEEYYIYKRAVMEKYDEGYIKLEDERAKQALEEYQQDQQQTETLPKQQINQEQQRLADRLEDASDSDDEEDQQIRICLCCNGNPYNCEQEQCKVMGSCVSCMFC